MPNLYKNAFEASPVWSKINISIDTDWEWKICSFSIENEPQISADILKKLFKEKISSKWEIKYWRWIGLSLTYRIVKSQWYRLFCKAWDWKTKFVIKKDKNYKNIIKNKRNYTRN